MKKFIQTSANNVQIVISLDDDCKNGHEDFSVTGSVWGVGKPQTDRYLLSCGQCTDEMREAFPEYSIFLDLHLSDFTGVPMFAVENSIYHIKEGNPEAAQRLLRCTNLELKFLTPITKADDFKCALYDLNIVERWKAEADKAIKMLEELTRDVFTAKGKSRLTDPTDSEIRAYKERLTSGYYSAESVKTRVKEAMKEAKKALKQKYKERKEKAIISLDIDYLIDRWKLETGVDNCIYYSHKKELQYNWSYCGKRVSEADFNKLVKKASKCKYLPEGIILTISNK